MMFILPLTKCAEKDMQALHYVQLYSTVALIIWCKISTNFQSSGGLLSFLDDFFITVV